MRTVYTKKARREFLEFKRAFYAGTLIKPPKEGWGQGTTLTFEEVLAMDSDKPQSPATTNGNNRKGGSPERTKGNGRR